MDARGVKKGRMDATTPAPTLSVLTEDEFEAQKQVADSSGCTLLLQLGSAACTRCPAFHDAIAELAATHQFTWLYCDAHHEDTDLPELFQIKQLPAFVIYTSKESEPLVVANAGPIQLRHHVVQTCTPVFTTDADF